MAKKRTEPAVNEVIATILKDTGQSSPAAAIRAKARELIQLYHTSFNESPPFDLKAMASMKGISHSDEAPVHSPDSELLPDDDGRVVMRINRDRPKTRQRFSIGHEITHTFFPGYEEKVQCRKPKERDWSEPEDVIEWLCDIGASEFLFPTPWFEKSVTRCSGTAERILDLAKEYGASPDATVRRYVEIATTPLAAVFLAWKLKPTQIRRARTGHRGLFGSNAIDCMVSKLRVDYAILSPQLEQQQLYVPSDKSVESRGVIYDAAAANDCRDGEEDLDLGSWRGRFRIHAIPLFTPEAELGPNGERSVAAVLEQVSGRLKIPRKPQPQGEGFFDSLGDVLD